MWSPSMEDYYYGLLGLEEGRRPPALAAPSPELEPSSPGRRRGTPAWARAIRGFSNATGLAIFVMIVAPLATRCTNKDEVFICAFLLAMSIAFPVLGYVITADLPDQNWEHKG